nr:ATP-binding protein [Pseudomonas sp.]
MSARRELVRNRRVLHAALDGFADYLSRKLAGEPTPHGAYLEAPPALAMLCDRLGLSRFEQDVLLLAIAAELDARFPPLLAQAQGDPNRPWPSFQLTLDLLPEPDWAAVTPVGRLRRWRLLEPGSGASALHARLLVDEPILHHVMGMSYPDPRLASWLRPLAGHASATPDPHIAQLAGQWQTAADLAATAIARFEGSDGEAFVQAVAAQLELRVYRLRSTELPTSRDESEQLARLWEREALLRGALLWIELERPEPPHAHRLADFLDGLQSLVVVSGEGFLPLRRAQWRLDWPERDTVSRHAAWRAALGERSMQVHGELDSLVEQFPLSPSAIQRVAACWQGSPDQLWQACRMEARHSLDHLAQRVEARASWEDLVLPEAALASLHAMVAQVRQRARVYREWGFAEGSSRGLGISALFVGGSGTGKTLAAEVLANELHLDLYRIDLAAMVSKYIGETEKNLARLFALAEGSGAILLFDEADALFGKRSEVHDSHDRYANVEVSYLLQRIESYRGLALLTSNLRQAIDPAFVRRLRFIVLFPFPDAQDRQAIWKRVFPREAPVDGLDLDKLARLSLSGGHIRNLALNAAFLAADEDSAITMHHLRIAAETEFAKLEKPLAAADVGDWQ